jgi:hypothetical protein
MKPQRFTAPELKINECRFDKLERSAIGLAVGESFFRQNNKNRPKLPSGLRCGSNTPNVRVRKLCNRIRSRVTIKRIFIKNAVLRICGGVLGN